ncbi:MAG TPA: carbon storage regulator CsrA [Candidatus Atribacteria bacterium]|nr:carbon storage regulator CsrA [Candidatus Atribacteria bacterium]
MLVVTRRQDEGIVINGDIRVVVLGVEDGKVRLGIEAPKSVKVYRDEIYEAVKQENKQAALADISLLSALPDGK